MISISVTTQGELLARLEGLPLKLRAAVVEKLTLAMSEAYSKAVTRQVSAGKYSATDEVAYGVERQGSLVIGYIEPLTTKAKVQEYGGKGYYVIEATNGKTLRFFWDKVGAVVFPKSVLHPPAAGKHYIEQALIAQVAPLNEAFGRILPEIMR